HAALAPARPPVPGPWRPLLGLLRLAELEFDRRRTPENQHRHPQAALLVVDFLDPAVEVVERTIHDADHLAGLEQHLRARLLDAFLDPVEDRGGLVVADRQRLVGGATDEAHDLGGLLDQVPALVVDARGPALLVGGDLHQHVAGEELALGTALLAGAHLHHFLGRHQHVAEAVFHAHPLDPVAQRLRHRLLEAGIGMHDVPAHVAGVAALAVRVVVLRFGHAAISVRHTASSHLTAACTMTSKNASSRLIATTTAITTQVVRVASWRFGQTTLRSSNRDSARNSRTCAPLRVVRNTTTPATTPPATDSTRATPGHWPSNQ